MSFSKGSLAGNRLYVARAAICAESLPLGLLLVQLPAQLARTRSCEEQASPLPPQHLPRQPPNPPPPVAAEQTTAEQGDGTRTLLMMLSSNTVSRSVLSDSATGWSATHQAPLSMGFSRREYWSGLPFPSPEDLSDPGIKHGSSSLQADS